MFHSTQTVHLIFILPRLFILREIADKQHQSHCKTVHLHTIVMHISWFLYSCAQVVHRLMNYITWWTNYLWFINFPNYLLNIGVFYHCFRCHFTKAVSFKFPVFARWAGAKIHNTSMCSSNITINVSLLNTEHCITLSKWILQTLIFFKVHYIKKKFFRSMFYKKILCQCFYFNISCLVRGHLPLLVKFTTNFWVKIIVFLVKK